MGTFGVGGFPEGGLCSAVRYMKAFIRKVMKRKE
jgi:hypothetical protein